MIIMDVITVEVIVALVLVFGLYHSDSDGISYYSVYCDGSDDSEDKGGGNGILV